MRALLLASSCLLVACQREPDTRLLVGAAVRGAACRGWDVDVPWWVPKLQTCVTSVVQRWTYDMPGLPGDMPQHCEALAASTTRLRLPTAGRCATRPRQRNFDPLWAARWSHQIIGCPELGPIVLNAVKTCARDAVEDAAKR